MSIHKKINSSKRTDRDGQALLRKMGKFRIEAGVGAVAEKVACSRQLALRENQARLG